MKTLPLKLLFCCSLSVLLSSCAAHKRSHIKANEEFVVELRKPATRGGMAELALQGLFLGANYLAEKSSKALTSSYSQKISVNDYYNTDLGVIEKSYNEIHIKKYANPTNAEKEEDLKGLLTQEFSSLPKSRGTTSSLKIQEVVREEKDDLLNFHAVIELVSDPKNPGVTRLSFNELYVFFSRTKVFSDVDLNARISVSIEGQWRSTDGSPMKATLIEQEYDFRNLKYGPENQIKEPILSPWYVDIPISTDELVDDPKYGVLEVNVQLEEYEGNRSKYINQLPSILSDNKNSIIKDGASTIQKITE